MRILRDPIGGDSGMISPAAPPPPQPSVPVPVPKPEPAPPKPPEPAVITLTAEQHRIYLDGLAERDRLKAADAERETKRREAEDEQLRKRGQFEELVAQRDRDLAKERDRLTEVERRSKLSELDRELALAIGSKPIVEGWLPHLMTLWRASFEVVPDGERWKVRSLDGKTPADFVAAQLARSEFAHIVRAENTGGPANRGNTTGRTEENVTVTGKGQDAFDRWNLAKEERQKLGYNQMGLKPISRTS